MHSKIKPDYEDIMIQKIVNYCRIGNIWGVRKILSTIAEEKRGCLLNKCDMNGDTALGVASCNGYLELTEYLLKIPDVDPNKETAKTKFSPLMLASVHGHKRIVMLLLKELTINTEMKNINKMTAAQEAVYASHSDIADLIRAR